MLKYRLGSILNSLFNVQNLVRFANTVPTRVLLLADQLGTASRVFLLADLEKVDTRYCCYILVLMLTNLMLPAVLYGLVLLIELIKLTNMGPVLILFLFS